MKKSHFLKTSSAAAISMILVTGCFGDAEDSAPAMTEAAKPAETMMADASKAVETAAAKVVEETKAAMPAVAPVPVAMSGGDSDKVYDEASYKKLHAEVIAAADKAADAGGEWRDTRWSKSTFVKWTTPAGETVKGSYVGVAEKAAAAGDYKKAMELLDTALFQANMGYQQAMEQKGAMPRIAHTPVSKYKTLLASTTAVVDKAAKYGGEWRDTRWPKSTFVKYTTPDGKTIKSSFMGAAKEAAKNGDYEKAIEFLETAKFQGEMGYKQAVEQEKAGPRF